MSYYGNKRDTCFTQRSDNKPFKKHLRHNITKKHENCIEFLKAFPAIQYWCKDGERMNIKVGVIN